MIGIAKIQAHFRNCMQAPSLKKVGSFSGRAVVALKEGFHKIQQLAQRVFLRIKESSIKTKNYLKERVFEPIHSSASKILKEAASRVECFRKRYCPFMSR